MSMHPKMTEALKLLEFGDSKTKHPMKEQAHALFQELYIASYLSPPCIIKAVDYLHAEHPFQGEPELIKRYLLEAYKKATVDGFDIDLFLNEFAKEDCFTLRDVIDLVAFISQFAFDRRFGEERDSLTTKPWMIENAALIVKVADHLDMLQGKDPTQQEYLGVAIMGAATSRVRSRIEYFKSIPPCYLSAWALSGARQLKVGLDEEKEMKAIAKFYHVPYELSGQDNSFLNITETQMVNYYLATLCKNVPIRVVDSAAEQDHWRATTQQGASDIAEKIVQQIVSGVLEVEKDHEYHFMIIAEQPYLNRMTRQVQREFNLALQRHGITDIKITVHGSGPSVSEELCQKPTEHLPALTRINSEMAVTLVERLNDARLAHPELAKRNINIILFRYRDGLYEQLQATPTPSVQAADGLGVK